MEFFQEHLLKLTNSEKEYKLLIKIEKNKDFIKICLNNKQYIVIENYVIKMTLDDFKNLHPYFKKFESIIECAKFLSNLIRDSSPQLFIETNGASLMISIFISENERKEIKFFLGKKEISISMIINSLVEEIDKLNNKVNDLEIILIEKNKKIEEIEKNNNEIKYKYYLLEKQQKIDSQKYKAFTPQKKKVENSNSYYLKSLKELMEMNNNETSTIINDYLELKFLTKKFKLMYPGKNIIYNLLYRKSRDSDKASAFHSKCDKIGGTLLLIKTLEGLKFGGYTNQTWEGNKIFKRDNTAFIFSLNLKKIYNILNNVNAIFCCQNFGPYFSGNNTATLLIYDNSDIQGGECCKARDSNYNGYFLDYEINNGRKKFKVNEIEVFKVTIV